MIQSLLVPECLVLHPETGKTQKDKEELRVDRRDSIQSVFNAMQRQSPTFVSFAVALGDAVMSMAAGTAPAPAASTVFENVELHVMD